MTPPDLRDRVHGCVLGGAVGDALGAPFEGLWGRSIPQGDELLADFAEFEGYPRGQYTDDTQLTVATLESVVRLGRIDPADVARRIARLWKSQAVIGPGGACMAAGDRLLAGEPWDRAGAPVGQAGNGAAMRTAALGLFFLDAPDDLAPTVADVSRITHQDPRAIAGGVAVAEAARLFAADPSIDPDRLCRFVADAIKPIHPEFAGQVAGLPSCLGADRPDALRYVAWSGMDRPEFDQPIITPFVVPTVLAALWATLTAPESWGGAVAAVIGLGGDVDTLGAIVGALMGARLGLGAIPAHLLEGVQDGPRLRELAAGYYNVIAAQGNVATDRL